MTDDHAPLVALPIGIFARGAGPALSVKRHGVAYISEGEFLAYAEVVFVVGVEGVFQIIAVALVSCLGVEDALMAIVEYGTLHLVELPLVNKVVPFEIHIAIVNVVLVLELWRHALQRMPAHEMVVGPHEDEKIPRGSAQGLVHRIVDSTVGLRHENVDPVLVLVEQFESAVGAPAVDDDVLPVMVRLVDD